MVIAKHKFEIRTKEKKKSLENNGDEEVIVPALEAVMKYQSKTNQQIEENIIRLREQTNETMKESYTGRDVFIREQVEIAKRLAKFEQEELEKKIQEAKQVEKEKKLKKKASRRKK